MRRRVLLRDIPLSIVLLVGLLLPATPGARAQAPPGEGPAGARGAPEGTGRPEREAAPEAEARAGAEPVVLSLEECLKQTLENSLDIAVRRYDPLKSGAAVTVSESAFDPLLTAGANGTKTVQSGISSIFGPFVSSDRLHTYAVGFADPLIIGGTYRMDVTAFDERSSTGSRPLPSLGYTTQWEFSYTQPLMRNLGARTNRWLIVTARNTLGQSESRFRQTVIETLASAEKAYWDLNFALMDLKTKRSSLQLAQDFLDQNRIKVRVGTLAPIEITQAEAGVADREGAVILAESAVQTAEDNLRRILNVPKGSPLWSRPIQPSDAPPLVESKPDLEEAVAVADQKRPDLEQARLDLKNRETELSYRKNQRRWGLDFQGAVGAGGFSSTRFLVDNNFDPITNPQGQPIILDHGSYGDAYDAAGHRDNRNWKVGLNLTVPIGNRQAVSNYTSAEYALSQSRFTLQQVEQGALVEVRNAVRAVETNFKLVKAAQVNTRLQREKLDAEQKKFENGMSTSFLVLSFQTDLATAESGENQAIVGYNKSLVELERVKGTLLEARKVALPGPSGAGSPRGPASSAWRPAPWTPGLSGGAGAALVLPGEERLVLPGRFVLNGRRLVAVGADEDGSGLTASAADGREGVGLDRAGVVAGGR